MYTKKQGPASSYVGKFHMKPAFVMGSIVRNYNVCVCVPNYSWALVNVHFSFNHGFCSKQKSSPCGNLCSQFSQFVHFLFRIHILCNEWLIISAGSLPMCNGRVHGPSSLVTWLRLPVRIHRGGYGSLYGDGILLYLVGWAVSCSTRRWWVLSS